MNGNDKVISIDELILWRSQCCEKGEKVVLTNGCFDLVHVGHLRSLEYAKSLGARLIVAINSDASVRSLKGEDRPLVSENERAELIGGFECVDRVVIFNNQRLTHEINLTKPDIYTKGGDYSLETMDSDERGALESCDAEITFFKLVANYSTTNLVGKIKGE